MIFQSLTFWTLLVGVIAFVTRWYFPTFPLDEITILSLVLFFLGLIGITPTLRAYGARALTSPPVINSLAFWQLVAGLVSFVIHFFAPDFPVGVEVILGVILFVLGYVGITPELRARGILPGGPDQQPAAAPPPPAAAPAPAIAISWAKIGLILMLWVIFWPLGQIGVVLFLVGALLYLVF